MLLTFVITANNTGTSLTVCLITSIIKVCSSHCSLVTLLDIPAIREVDSLGEDLRRSKYDLEDYIYSAQKKHYQDDDLKRILTDVSVCYYKLST
jgi:hypothetical protein